jgi:site-specific DNA-methyltransferase (adenine-specific)
MKSALANTAELDGLIRFLDDRKKRIVKQKDKGNGITVAMNSVGEFSIPEGVLCSIINGNCEKSIIDCVHDRYTRIHPTQKPVRLLQRLLALVSKEGDLLLDPFSGSASTAIAAFSLNRRFIGFEIDKEYYEKSIDRLQNKLGVFIDMQE